MSGEGEVLRGIAGQVEKIDSRLEKLETIVNERLYDTRPLWSDLQPRIHTIEQTVGEHTTTLNDIHYLLRAINDNMLRVQAAQKRMEDLLQHEEEVDGPSLV
jgi:hypothetical protein